MLDVLPPRPAHLVRGFFIEFLYETVLKEKSIIFIYLVLLIVATGFSLVPDRPGPQVRRSAGPLSV